jgi:mono/diheme cytochrome c family protein
MTRSINGKTIAVFFTACAFLLLSTMARADDASAKLYSSKCAACHAADGSGNTAAGKALKTADLRDPDIQKQTDAELNAEITKGKDKMPPYEKQLKPDEIKGLVAYVRELAKK